MFYSRKQNGVPISSPRIQEKALQLNITTNGDSGFTASNKIGDVAADEYLLATASLHCRRDGSCFERLPQALRWINHLLFWPVAMSQGKLIAAHCNWQVCKATSYEKYEHKFSPSLLQKSKQALDEHAPLHPPDMVLVNGDVKELFCHQILTFEETHLPFQTSNDDLILKLVHQILGCEDTLGKLPPKFDNNGLQEYNDNFIVFMIPDQHQPEESEGEDAPTDTSSHKDATNALELA
ncbi:hypothetical protein PR048_016845 [Dryococelus australis]|uniref:Uncharacterized protein n=1 Tax=Dryococelus australis TaxID=614101 RepID=A0ABQ9H7Y7_9NEOP|nr:hypothetical protein PR048_016845 [Dryococelus australis]